MSGIEHLEEGPAQHSALRMTSCAERNILVSAQAPAVAASAPAALLASGKSVFGVGILLRGGVCIRGMIARHKINRQNSGQGVRWLVIAVWEDTVNDVRPVFSDPLLRPVNKRDVGEVGQCVLQRLLELLLTPG